MAKKRYIELTQMEFRCGYCGLLFNVEGEDTSFYSDSHECDMCGSHGEVTTWVTCPGCQKHEDVILYSW